MRRDQSQFRMVPAEQGFHLAYGAFLQIEDRLVVERELSHFQGVLKVLLQNGFSGADLLHAGIIHPDGVLFLLGDVQGHVGMLDGLVEAFPSGADANAGRQKDDPIVDFQLSGYGLQEVRCQPAEIFSLGGGSQDDELIPAVVIDSTLVADCLLDHRAQFR